MFKVGQHDFSNQIIAGSYEVNAFDDVKEWVDANYKRHPLVKKTSVKGTLNVHLRTYDDYDRFLYALKHTQNSDGTYLCEFYVNNTNEDHMSNYFLRMSPAIIKRNGKDNFAEFVIEVEEL